MARLSMAVVAVAMASLVLLFMSVPPQVVGPAGVVIALCSVRTLDSRRGRRRPPTADDGR